MVKKFDWAIFLGIGIVFTIWGLHQIFIIPRFNADHWAWLTLDPQVIEYFKFWFVNHGIWTICNGLFVMVISATGYRNRERWAWATIMYVPIHIFLLTSQFFWLAIFTLPIVILLMWLLWVNSKEFIPLKNRRTSFVWMFFLLISFISFVFAFDNLFVIPTLALDHPERGWDWLTNDLEVFDYIKLYFRVFGIRVFGFGIFTLLISLIGLRQGSLWAWRTLLFVPLLCIILALRWPWVAIFLIGLAVLSGLALWLTRTKPDSFSPKRIQL